MRTSNAWGRTEASTLDRPIASAASAVVMAAWWSPRAWWVVARTSRPTNRAWAAVSWSAVTTASSA